MTDTIEVIQGSGNIFADLDFEHQEEELLKARLAREVRAILERRRLTQENAASRMGLEQPDVSDIATAAPASSRWTGWCGA